MAVGKRGLSDTTTRDGEQHWCPALWLGLISSTYSTLLITLGAGRIGRDPAVDWTQVAMAYFGRDVLSADPTWGAILAGVFVHQSADIFWALAFFGCMWRWTRQLSPWHILIVAIPWAVLTAAIEYYLTLPWLQPWLMMQVPYWTALSVHLASASVYPLFPLLRQDRDDQHSQRLILSRWWGVGLVLALVSMGGLWALGESGHEVRWPFVPVQTDSPDGRFLIHMTAHHEVGLQLAQLAAVRSRASGVQDLGKLMAAEHKAEMARMHTWWQSWFQGDMPGVNAQEYQHMVGMPPPDLLQRLEKMGSPPFDRLFLPIMLRHHEGAIVMCNRILQRGSDPRTSLLAVSIRHAQVPQMEEMRRLLRERSNDGSAAVPYTW